MERDTPTDFRGILRLSSELLANGHVRAIVEEALNARRPGANANANDSVNGGSDGAMASTSQGVASVSDSLAEGTGDVGNTSQGTVTSTSQGSNVSMSPAGARSAVASTSQGTSQGTSANVNVPPGAVASTSKGVNVSPDGAHSAIASTSQGTSQGTGVNVSPGAIASTSQGDARVATGTETLKSHTARSFYRTYAQLQGPNLGLSSLRSVLRSANPPTIRTVRAAEHVHEHAESPGDTSTPYSHPVSDWVHLNSGFNADFDEQPFADRLTDPSSSGCESPRSDIYEEPAAFDDNSYISVPRAADSEENSQKEPSQPQPAEIVPTPAPAPISHKVAVAPAGDEAKDDNPSTEEQPQSEVSVEGSVATERDPEPVATEGSNTDSADDSGSGDSIFKLILEQFQEQDEEQDDETDSSEVGAMMRMRQLLLSLTTCMMRTLEVGVINPVKGAVNAANFLSKRVGKLVQDAVSWFRKFIQVMKKKVPREKWREIGWELTLHAVMAITVVVLLHQVSGEREHAVGEHTRFTIASGASDRGVRGVSNEHVTHVVYEDMDALFGGAPDFFPR